MELQRRKVARTKPEVRPGDPRPYPELTTASVAFGVVLGILMNAAMTYTGLKVGFTTGGWTVAALLGFATLRGPFRRGSILETNLGQTIASTINYTCAGVVFTIPALFLLDPHLSPKDPIFFYIGGAAVLGAVLGCTLIVPLRKQMIEVERLRFPSSVAVATVLRVPGAGRGKLLVLVVGVLIGALVFIPTNLAAQRAKVPNQLDLARLIGLPAPYPLALAISPALLGIGYIVGRRAMLLAAGGALSSWVLIPWAYGRGWLPAAATATAALDAGREALGRPLGLGLLFGGAVAAIFATVPSMVATLRALIAATPKEGDRDELGPWASFVAWPIAAAVLFLAAWNLLAEDAQAGLLGGLPLAVRCLIVSLSGTAWIWFAAVVVARCTGMTDFTPTSGVVLITVLFVLAMTGSGRGSGAILGVIVAAALSVAVNAAADAMTDLKTGQLVGAKPRTQQILDIATVGLGPVVSMATLMLIITANVRDLGTAIGPSTGFAAPQAKAVAAVITAVRGETSPQALYALGGILGLLLELSMAANSAILVGLGMFLPLAMTLMFGAGGLLSTIAVRLRGPVWSQEWGVPFCVGLILGESIPALAVNLILIVRG